MRSLLLALTLLGCGPMPVELDGGAPLAQCDGGQPVFSAGSRLRLQYADGEDGLRAPRGFFDTMQNVGCSYQLADDNVLRCLPVEDLAFVLPATFADSACTQPVALGTCSSQRFARDIATTCPPRNRLFTVTPLTGVELYARAEPNAACTLVPRVPGLLYFRVGPAVPASQWAAGVARLTP